MACKIKRTMESRPISLKEFKQQKNVNPYKDLRQVGKKLNFLTVFGGSGKVFSDQALDTTWSERQIDEYIADNSEEMEPIIEHCDRVYKDEAPKKRKYIAVATLLRKNFLEGYYGLAHRIEREKKFGHDNGFCRSEFGAVRNLIELLLQGEWDEQNSSGVIRNLENICANVRAQNLESCIRGRAQYDVQQWLKRNGYESKTWNEIHDSADFWIAKNELKDVLAHIKHVFERKIPELRDNWVPLIIDCEVSDLLKGEYYKGGSDPQVYGVDWDTCKYEDPDPFNVELDPEFEKEYFLARREYWDKKGAPDPIQGKIDEYFTGNGWDIAKPKVVRRIVRRVVEN